MRKMSESLSKTLCIRSRSCVTCFSQDRNLFTMKNIGFMSMFCPEIAFKAEDKICWECECIIRKLIKFKEKALTTQTLLSQFVSSATVVTNSLTSLRNTHLFNVSVLPDEDDSLIDKMIIIDKPETIDNEDIKDNIEVEIKPIKLEIDDIKSEFDDESERDFDNESSDSDNETVGKKIKRLKREREMLKKENGVKIKKERMRKERGKKSTKKYQHQKSKERNNYHDTSLSEKSTEKKQLKLYNGDREVIATIHEMKEDKMMELRERDRIEDSFRRCKLKCMTCIQRFGTRKKFEEHNLKHEMSCGELICSICEQRFSSDDDLEEHRKGHYRCYRCVTCLAEFSTHEVFKCHYEANHRKSTRKCIECDLIFATKSQQRNHKIKVHDKKPACPICGRECSSPTNLKRHMLQHTGIPMVECEICHRKLKGQDGLRLHMRSHDDKIDESAYCAECNIQFKSQQIYRIHLKSTLKHRPAEEFKHKCLECGKSFAFSVCLRRHVEAVHRKELQYACRTCGKKFNIKMQMRMHERKEHEGIEKPKDKVCDYCAKAFQTKVQLTIHIRTHTGERPFQCELCSMAFSQGSTLKTHLRGVHKHLNM